MVSLPSWDEVTSRWSSDPVEEGVTGGNTDEAYVELNLDVQNDSIYLITTLMLMPSWTAKAGDSATMPEGFDQGTSWEEDTWNNSETEPNWSMWHWHCCQMIDMNTCKKIT